MECICWSPDNLEKMSEYYCMNCTPSKKFESLRINPYGKYDFEMKWERSRRGHKYYRQRMHKGKWRHV